MYLRRSKIRISTLGAFFASVPLLALIYYVGHWKNHDELLKSEADYYATDANYLGHSFEQAKQFAIDQSGRLHKLGLKNLNSIEYYNQDRSNSTDTNIRAYREFLKYNAASFYKIISRVWQGKLFKGYIAEKRADEILIFVPMPHIPPIQSFYIFSNIARSLQFTSVFMDVSPLLTTSTDYTETQLISIVEDEMATFLTSVPRGTRVHYNIICFGFLLFQDYLKKHPSQYETAVVYAPMVKEIEKGHMFDPKDIYPSSHKMMPYLDLLTVFHVMTGDRFFDFATPSKGSAFNLSSFSNLYHRFVAGVDMSGISNTFAIVSDKDKIVTAKNSASPAFRKVSTLTDSDHISIFYDDRVMDQYVAYLKKFISTDPK